MIAARLRRVAPDRWLSVPFPSDGGRARSGLRRREIRSSTRSTPYPTGRIVTCRILDGVKHREGGPVQASTAAGDAKGRQGRTKRPFFRISPRHPGPGLVSGGSQPGPGTQPKPAAAREFKLTSKRKRANGIAPAGPLVMSGPGLAVARGTSRHVLSGRAASRPDATFLRLWTIRG